MVKRFRKGIPILIAVFLASVYWILFNLNQIYQTTISVPIKLIGIPDEVNLNPVELTPITINVEGVGVDLLSYRLNNKSDTVEIPYSEAFSSGYLLPSFYTNNIKRNLSGLQLLGVFSPDTIKFKHDLRVHKKVPLISRVNINLTPQFLLEQAATLEPDSVTIMGPQLMLDTIDYWYTNQIETNTISRSKELEVSLMDTMPIIVSPRTAKISIHPVRYTQLNLQIPVSVVDIPQNRSVKLTNHILKLSCLVPLSEYESLEQSAYKIEHSYLLLDPRIPYFLPDLSFLPSKVKVLSKSPSRIPYIIVEHAS